MDDVIGNPIIGDVTVGPVEGTLADKPLVVKLQPVVIHAMALTTLIEHGMRQAKIMQDMLGQAEFALQRARDASNDGTGSVLKMIIPVMISRKQYLYREIQMWALVMEAAEIELNDLKPELDEIDAANAAKEALDGSKAGVSSGMAESEPCDYGSPRDECDGANDPDEIPEPA